VERRRQRQMCIRDRAIPPKAVADNELKVPPKEPMGVLTAATI
jgi:hypothetical protein